MKNLICGHIYLLKKDRFFIACLGIALVFLVTSIRASFFGSELTPVTGLESITNAFLGGNIILYAFMLLTANVIAEDYRCGTIKNIVGKGISNKNYYLSIIFTISSVYLLTMLVYAIIMGCISSVVFGLGSFKYPLYYVLSIIARIFFVITYISFAATMTVVTMNAIAGVILGLLIPYIPNILNAFLGFLKINFSFDFLDISSHMPSFYDASNNLSPLLPCFVVIAGYFVFSLIIGFQRLKHQDIK